MTTTGEYAAYVTALQAVIDLPKSHAVQVESIERRAVGAIEELDRRRNEEAQRWTQHRDNSARLARRINELASKVGAPPAGFEPPESMRAAAIPAALDTLRAELERAEQSWQWLVRHRERERAMTPPQPPPVYVAPPAPPPAAPEPVPPPKAAVNPMVLIGVAGLVIVVLVIVIIAMAV